MNNVQCEVYCQFHLQLKTNKQCPAQPAQASGQFGMAPQPNNVRIPVKHNEQYLSLVRCSNASVFPIRELGNNMGKRVLKREVSN